MDISQSKATIERLVSVAGTIILGKDHQLRLAITCMLARGHLLIEDLPGVGKTTLAHTLAKVLGLQFQRIQFTSDMLPADILGASVYNRDMGNFQFIPGPIFAQVVLADEVNRTTPKTQSALLEAMEEQQVTIEGQTHRLPTPFFVIATQNPNYQVGTFPLPESQLDRFTMRLTMGYPDRPAERALLRGDHRRELLANLAPAVAQQDLMALQACVPKIHASDALIDYLQALLSFSRESVYFHTGLSPRAGLSLMRAAQAWALMEGRAHIIPEDVQAVLPSVVSHRLIPNAEYRDKSPVDLAQYLHSVAVP